MLGSTISYLSSDSTEFKLQILTKYYTSCAHFSLILGSSFENYILHLVQDGVLSGYRPIVFNQRGNGGLYLKVRRDKLCPFLEMLKWIIIIDVMLR